MKRELMGNRKKSTLFHGIDGKILIEFEPYEAYWCVDSDHALIFLKGEEYAIMERSREQLINDGYIIKDFVGG